MQAGVYLCLNINGTLEVIKNSGELSIHERKDGTVLLSSELSYTNYKQAEANRGWYKFNPDGKFSKFVERKWTSTSYKNQSWVYGGGNYKTSSHYPGGMYNYGVANQNEYMGD